MSTDRRVKALSRHFSEFGLIPEGRWAGQPIFQYRRGHELRIPTRKFTPGSGKAHITPELVREVTRMRAMNVPEPAITVFVNREFAAQTANFESGPMIKVASGLFVPNTAAQFELGYQSHPHDQRWVIARWMQPDCTPEAWTEKYQGALEFPRDGYFFIFQPTKEGFTPTEDWTMWVVGTIKEQMSMNASQHLEKIEDQHAAEERSVDDSWGDYVDQTLVDHIPGVRGGTISVPATRFDR